MLFQRLQCEGQDIDQTTISELGVLMISPTSPISVMAAE